MAHVKIPTKEKPIKFPEKSFIEPKLAFHFSLALALPRYSQNCHILSKVKKVKVNDF